jgi:hypothetical protein
MDKSKGTKTEIILGYLSRLLTLTMPPPTLVPVRIQTKRIAPHYHQRALHPMQHATVWPTPKPRSRIKQAPRPLTK